MALKTQTERYAPGNLPATAEGLIQFLFDELPRIAAALNSFPVALNVFESHGGVPVDTVPNEFRLFEGIGPTLDIPGGAWDSVLGEWKCPAAGLYIINVTANVAAFGAGNKDYACTLKIYADDVEIISNPTVGDDAFPLGAAIAIGTFIQRETIIRSTITLVHEQFAGSTTVGAYMTIISTALE